MIIIKQVTWDPENLTILLDKNGEEKTIVGNCKIPYHPSKFNVPEVGFGVFGIGNKILKLVTPKKWTAESYMEAMDKTKINYVLRRDCQNIEGYVWKRNGKKIYERIFEDDTILPPFLPQPITRGVRIFKIDENTIRVALYYLEEVRINKWDLKV